MLADILTATWPNLATDLLVSNIHSLFEDIKSVSSPRSNSASIVSILLEKSTSKMINVQYVEM